MGTRTYQTLPPRQRGAALIIGLILLLILTVLGVSSMNTATMELAMAINSQQSQYAFQAAESALVTDIVVGNTIVLDNNTVQGDNVRNDVYNYEPIAGINIPSTVSTAYESTLNCPQGYELDGALGGGIGVKCVHFIANSQAQAARGAISNQVAGFHIPAPSP